MIDYPFVPDKEVLGRWKVRDFVSCREEFDPARQNRYDIYYSQGLEFCEGGVLVATTKAGRNGTASTWTRGLVLHSGSKTSSAYEIVRIDGEEYLFCERKSGDYSFGGQIHWDVYVKA